MDKILEKLVVMENWQKSNEKMLKTILMQLESCTNESSVADLPVTLPVQSWDDLIILDEMSSSVGLIMPLIHILKMVKFQHQLKGQQPVKFLMIMMLMINSKNKCGMTCINLNLYLESSKFQSSSTQ
ncbi:uncharacterized protein LOC136086034 isoform X2 [Hydra vulgaris]|uniref:Uncharacterized protein LOC136086034 isoform X2 n=1 Tax=Hydra vulgaris TaxID=6087 RepID=A0ABM4CR42_HYDVU